MYRNSYSHTDHDDDGIIGKTRKAEYTSYLMVRRPLQYYASNIFSILLTLAGINVSYIHVHLTNSVWKFTFSSSIFGQIMEFYEKILTKFI